MFHEPKQSRGDEEYKQNGKKKSDNLKEPDGDGPKEKNRVCRKSQEPENPEYPEKSNKSNLQRSRKKYWKDRQNRCQIDEAEDVKNEFYPVTGTVESGCILDYEKYDNNRFCFLVEFLGGFGNRVGVDDEKDAHQYIQEDNKNIDQFPGECFTVYQEKLYCFPQGLFRVLVFFHKKK